MKIIEELDKKIRDIIERREDVKEHEYAQVCPKCGSVVRMKLYGKCPICGHKRIRY